ncbi:MAG: hypothetical protein E7218_06720 [Anaerofustis stercorihominis]|nr:hypothetical protein [Anaerofustis stercorihominis]
MQNGISFVDILTSEITMIVGAVLLLFSAFMLVFKRKSISARHRLALVAVLAVSAVYEAFIVWLVIMFS